MHGTDDTHDVYPPHWIAQKDEGNSDNDEDDDDENDDDDVDEDSSDGESSVASYTTFPYHHFQFAPDAMHLFPGIFLSSLVHIII